MRNFDECDPFGSFIKISVNFEGVERKESNEGCW